MRTTQPSPPPTTAPWSPTPALGALRRGNGASVVRIFGLVGTDRRGATIAMNFFDPSGVLIDSARVERRANMAGISLRSGCHCNSGGGRSRSDIPQKRWWPPSKTRTGCNTKSSPT